MAYNEKLAGRIREALGHLPKVEEKKMFRGLTFMIDGKMCTSVSGEEMMCRFDPTLQEIVTEENGFRPMMMRGRQLNSYGYISLQALKTKKEFNYWVDISLAYNKHAKASKKKNKK